MSESKVTYLSAVRFAIENGNLPADVSEKLNQLAESLEKRANAIRKPTKKQLAAAEARESIPERMEQGEVYTASEVGKLFGQSAQWATPKLTALVSAGVVIRTVEKGKAFYSLA